MPIIRDWNKYLTQDELDKRIYDSIRKNAKDVAFKIKEANNKENSTNNELSYV